MIEGEATTRFSLDFSRFNGLRSAARAGSGVALEEAAAQFESLFVQFALQAMREATLGDGLLDSEQSKFYQGLLDQQFALSLTSGHRSLGLKRMLTDQLGKHQEPAAAAKDAREGSSPGADIPRLKKTSPAAANFYKAVHDALDQEVPAASDAGAGATTSDGQRIAPSPDTGASAADIGRSREAFVRGLWPLAEEAGRHLGVSPRVLVAQAALETGWGRYIPQRADGTHGHNLFGIKAGGGWRGERVAAHTWEVEDGQRVPARAEFRGYDSFAESFNDYVNFLQTNPRYAGALRAAADPEAFVDALQRAGFATDPQYAQKIRAIMDSRIGAYEPDAAGGKFG